MNLRYNYRIYPNKEQVKILNNFFGHSRFVYNYFLDRRSKSYKDGVKMNYSDTSKELTSLKKNEDYNWLSEVSSVCLQQSLRNLDKAFSSFFKRNSRYPKFKSKGDKQSFTLVNTAFSLNGGVFYIAKIGNLKVKWHRELPSRPTSLSVTKSPSGKYFVSFVVLVDKEEKDLNHDAIGIDFGVKDFATLSDGVKIKNPKHIKRHSKKLKRLQHELSRKKKNSNRRKKAKLKLAKAHEKVANCRKDFVHKKTKQIIDKYGDIFIEDLNIRGMIESQKISKNINKSIYDVGLGMAINFLKYKSELYGNRLHQVDRYFPSSKICSSCGHINESLNLSDRQWVCRDCEVSHDRDLNAAKNILTAGTVGLAHGDLVIPS